MFMGVRKEAKWPLVPLEIGNWNYEPKLIKKTEISRFLQWQVICRYDIHTAQEQVNCSDVMQS